MTVLGITDTVRFDAHGSTFASYVASRNSEQLCAWKLTVPPGSRGVAHRPSRDEVLLVLDGLLHITIDGTPSQVEPGNVALVRAGAEVVVDGGPQGGWRLGHDHPGPDRDPERRHAAHTALGAVIATGRGRAC
ncbi:cupin domain-containing protein [Rhodococcus zopfii]|uniref:Cupin domain-containing protein n=1 Tax=Rhodococcus zopfii TaxID=43772 RepID=A0ABU3WPK3_9NOCA|nr:cupin domain-containing protein [Rhodococcus zopfii]